MLESKQDSTIVVPLIKIGGNLPVPLSCHTPVNVLQVLAFTKGLVYAQHTSIDQAFCMKANISVEQSIESSIGPVRRLSKSASGAKANPKIVYFVVIFRRDSLHNDVIHGGRCALQFSRYKTSKFSRFL